jgi:hypothetical protein
MQKSAGWRVKNNVGKNKNGFGQRYSKAVKYVLRKRVCVK